MKNEYFAKKDETIGCQACKKTKNSLLVGLGKIGFGLDSDQPDRISG